MDNKQLIAKLGFAPKENAVGIFIKRYQNHGNYAIEIDFTKEIINYGKLIKSDNKTTQNFSQSENWVVLECVDRLLTKGYKPKNIVLEKTWGAGHGTSGRLDICVTREDSSEYLLIECKTAGKEFDKEFARMKKDGGQLFTYFKFSNKADVIMLYASELRGKTVSYKNEIIKIEDDYRSGDVKDFYDKWNKLTKDNGIFDTWVKPYCFESKALIKSQLKPIGQEDSSFIFNRFLEILRHNVVSDKGNAFNKIFTLFLCKVYDETSVEGNDELKFQWLEGIDDDVSFQLRLTELYKNGMLKFLEREVSDFDEDGFNKCCHDLSEEAKKYLLKEVHKVRLEKNNEFAIKEVYDHQSFVENAKIVKEVVELLQGYRIRYNKRQQYLSDFFELLLTTGLKQEAGQFFTPVPISQFIIKSLPLDNIVNQKLKQKDGELLPFMIDYAAGSGHFITEYMHEVQRIINDKKPQSYIDSTAKKIKNWQEDHFDWATTYVYGIEKDYRLVKVGKVGCYLHGDGLANVILSDGLGNFVNTKEYKGKLRKANDDGLKDNQQFDVVLSNPPYSVSSFRQTTRDYYTEADFDLYDKLTDNSSEIECLFIERTKQLLKDGGVAGIILPSSILSNTGMYTKTRELILQYFEIIALAELGSNTFMATGTNTVVLFLRRRNNYDSINLRKAVDKFFANFNDVTLNGVENPVSKYVEHAWEGITFADYINLLQKGPNQAVERSELYQDYRKKIKSKNDKEFLNAVLDIEKEKILYFILAYPQKVVLIKTGEKDAEKLFVGYEFSNRRGSEGIHPIQRGKTIDECTSLFDTDIFDNEMKASTYIYKAFSGDFDFKIDESLSDNVSRNALTDMMVFDRSDFEKIINLNPKKKVKVNSKWEQKTLNEICEFIGKGLKPASFANAQGNIPFIVSSQMPKKCDSADFNMEAIIIGDGGQVNVHYINGGFSASNHTYILKLQNLGVNLRYVYDLLSNNLFLIEEGFTGSSLKNVSKNHLQDIKIPLPPMDVQGKIVTEIKKIEEVEKQTKKNIESLLNNISKILNTKKTNFIELGRVASLKNGLNYSRESNGEAINIVGVGDFQDNVSPNIDLIEKIQIDGNLSEDYLLNIGDLLVVRSNGSANLVGRFMLIDKTLPKLSFSGFTIRLRPDQSIVNSKYLCYYLRTEKVRELLTTNSNGSNIKSLNQTLLSSLPVNIPSLSEQKEIMVEIEKIEKQIAEAQKIIDSVPQMKKCVLKKYL